MRDSRNQQRKYELHRANTGSHRDYKKQQHEREISGKNKRSVVLLRNLHQPHSLLELCPPQYEMKTPSSTPPIRSPAPSKTPPPRCSLKSDHRRPPPPTRPPPETTESPNPAPQISSRRHIEPATNPTLNASFSLSHLTHTPTSSRCLPASNTREPKREPLLAAGPPNPLRLPCR